MKISFKDINGIKVKGEVEYIYPRLSQDGKIHSWYFCIKLEDGRFIKAFMYAEIQKLKKKLAEYEQAGFGFMSKGKIETVHLDSEEETKLQEELAKMKQIVINSEQAQKLSDYINNLHNVVGELKFIPLNEIPAIHLNSFEDCQKLEAEPIKADDSQTKKFAPPFTSVSKVEMYSSDGEKIAETKTNKPDNYDEIINRLLKFRTRVQHEHIQFRNGLLELIDIVLKLAREVQGDERKAN